jgi:hypothetical protein
LRPWPPRLVLLAFVVGCALAHGAGAQPDEARAVLAREAPALVEALLARKVVLADDPGAAPGVARGLVIFEQPIDRTFLLLAQSARQREYRPDLAGIEAIEALPDGSVDEHRMRILFLDIRYRIRHRSDRERRRLTWELAPGYEHDLARLEGSWELYPLPPQRTLGVFETRVEVGAALPSFLQEYATRKNLPRTLERCRRWVDGDGRLDD